MGRRAFVGGTVAASAGLLTLIGGKQDDALAQTHSHAPQPSDPMFRLLIQESIAIRRDMKSDRAKGEHGRRHATVLRALTTYGQQIRLDDRVRSELGQLLRQQGQEAVVQASVDHHHIVAELRAEGVVDPEELPDPNLLTREQRRAGLTEIMRQGVTPMLVAHAELADRGARGLDRYGAAAPPRVRHVALRLEISKEECEKAYDSQLLITRAASTFICLTPPLWEICLLLQLDILLMETLRWYFCSDLPE